jgi:hypothetical protein
MQACLRLRLKYACMHACMLTTEAETCMHAFFGTEAGACMLVTEVEETLPASWQGQVLVTF